MTLREKIEKAITDRVRFPGAERILLDMIDASEKKQEAIDLIILCAEDIVNDWPKMTMRTLGQMTKSIETLRQALEEAKR